MEYTLLDVKEKVQQYDEIYKIRISYRQLNQEITTIPVSKINFIEFNGHKDMISGFNIRSESKNPEFSFSATDFTPDRIEINESDIKMYSGSTRIWFMLTK